MTTMQKLFTEVSQPVATGGNKVTIVGVGAVGMVCAYALLTERLTNELVLMDMVKDKLQGEMLDLQHGAAFLRNVSVKSSTDDYSLTKNSRIVIITAGARQREGESRLALVQRNTDIFKSIIPQIMKYNSDTILLVVSNPVDILTYVAWKLSGLPIHKVIGSGTNLDTSRFKFLISEKLNIAPSSCHGWIIGEHGDNSVPVWSSVNVSGVRLTEINPKIGTAEDEENWLQLHKEVVNSAYTIIKLKGYTSWAIGLSVADICRGLIRNNNNLYAVSTLVKGFHNIKEEVFLSLPAALGCNGITQVVNQKLTPSEVQQLQESARVIAEVQSGIRF
ncbi:L-lactate dehydrogenase-like isoform X2 [Chrysoperla carnea]|uniref:L-lactate dehydrogenase-like isoform X2 n=1 Tax=Chrysoperla carnea TaxID=189513 RepID=UPI001D0966DF|nr:L-lactate dehydrogenase-like isoform X2 [Chrysoperla carnea]